MKKEKKFYVGSREVANVSVAAKLDLVGVLYTDGYNEDFTKAQWEDVRSEKPYKDGDVALKKHEHLIKKIIRLMKEDRVTLQEHEWILQRVNESIGQNYRECLRKMFSVKEPENIMLAMIDVILKEGKFLEKA